MYRRMMRIGAASVILILSLGLLMYAHTEADTGLKKAVIQECILSTVQKDGTEGISLYAKLEGDIPLWIDSWEKDGRRWLFLPSLFRGQEASFQDELLILEEGRRKLPAKGGGETEIQILFGSEIPFACLETESGSMDFLKESKENKEKGGLCFVGTDHTLEYTGNLSKVKIRGNATRLQPKSPFRIKLEKAASLAGLGASRDYVLLAEYGDISLMYNKAAMELAGRTTKLYEPYGEHMDLYVNGEYMGVYLLCEGISIGENRLEIRDLEHETDMLNAGKLDAYEPFAEMSDEDTMAKGYKIPNNPEDITGGYLLELEYHGRYEGEEEVGFRTARDWSLVVKEPSCASREQVSYIQEKFQQAENAMYAQDWTEPEKGLPLERLVDMESFVHKYLVDEICMNTDLWTSQFLYKNRGDAPFCFGPIWDYDMAFGHYDTGFSPEEFYANWHIWYEEVYENPKFQQILRQEYQERYLPVLKELTDTKLQEWKARLASSAEMNFTRWDIEEIYSRNSIIHTGDSFGECVDSLENFIKTRTEFLSSEWVEKP